MTNKTWARLVEGAVFELQVFDSALVPGEDVPALWTDDVTSVTGIAVGWIMTGNAWAAPPVVVQPVVVPQTISRRQFFQQLAVQDVITEDEAFAAMSGTLPAALTTLVADLPTGQQFDAKMKLMVPTFDRSDPIVAVFGTAKGWSSDQIDALWTAAAAL